MAEIEMGILCQLSELEHRLPMRIHHYSVEKWALLHLVTSLPQGVVHQQRRPMGILRDAPYALWPVVHGEKARHGGQQSLRRADIASGLLAFYMLLAGLERHAERGVAMPIYRDPDDTPRHRTLELIAGGEVGCVRASTAHRNAEPLGRPHGDVCPPLARRH